MNGKVMLNHETKLERTLSREKQQIDEFLESKEHSYYQEMRRNAYGIEQLSTKNLSCTNER